MFGGVPQLNESQRSGSTNKRSNTSDQEEEESSEESSEELPLDFMNDSTYQEMKRELDLKDHNDESQSDAQIQSLDE